MTGFHGKVLLAALAPVVLLGMSLIPSDARAAPVTQESREASFLPPTSADAPLALITQSLSSSPSPDEKEKSASPLPPSATSLAPQAAPSPDLAAPAPSSAPPVAPKGSLVGANQDAKAGASPSQVTPAPAVMPTTYAPTPPPSGGAAIPESASPLTPVNPNAFGLLSPDEGGLGTDMWKGTASATVERLMPSLALPLASPTLNRLAYRLLASASSPPEDASSDAKSSPTLTSLRIDRLLALGRAKEAWRLAILAKPGQIDKAVLRAAAEAALASSDQASGAEACVRAPELLKATSDPDWQKILVVCHLRANDTKAAQLGLDVMATQNVKDDLFLELASKNVLERGKQLPRRLTPLAPLSLALIRLANLPLRNELYARPPAALIPEVLKAGTESLNARLALAERAAAAGLIDEEQLGRIYADVDFTNFPLAARETDANKVRENGSLLRARLYQIAMGDTSSDNRLNAALRLIQSVSPPEQGGAMRNLARAMLKGLTPASASSLMSASPAAALMISLLADDTPERTLGWLKLARDEASRTPSVARALISLWPLIALGGFESDKDFARNLREWLAFILNAEPAPQAPTSTATTGATVLEREESALRERRHVAGVVLLTLNAAGLSVPEDAWAQVVDASDAFEKTSLPPALLIERLKEAGRSKRKGETVLASLAAAGPSGSIPLFVRLDIVRALRNSGLPEESVAFARETLLAARAVSAGGTTNGDAPR